MNKISEKIVALKNKTTEIVNNLDSRINKNITDKVVKISIGDIIRDEEPFKSLNPVDDAQRARLEDSIRKNGFLK